MKHVTATLQTLNSAMRDAPRIDDKAMEWLVGKLIDRLGAEKVGRMLGEGGRDAWAEELRGFSAVEIKRGLHEVSMRRFPPTLGEFAVFCRPCLEPEAAYVEAVHCLKQRDRGEVGDWTHTAVWRAASSMPMEVRADDFPKYRVKWAAALKRELAHGWGDPVPPPRQVIGYTQGAPAKPPEAVMNLKRLLAEEQRRRREREAAAKAQEQQP